MMNLLPYRRKGRWGYVTRAGEVAVPPRFTWAGAFQGGLARVCSAGFVEESHEIIDKAAFAFIDESGELALPTRFDQACDVSEGLACVNVGASIGYAHYDGRHYVHGGLWGYVDRSGFKLPPQFDYAQSFSEGVAAVKRGETWTFIDRHGAAALSGEFQQAQSFNDGLAAVVPLGSAPGAYGYIDHTGALTIPPRWNLAYAFCNGLALVFDKKQYKYFYLNREGDVEIEVRESAGNAGPFRDGRARASKAEIRSFNNGSGMYASSGPDGFIDRTGTFVIPPKFQSAGDFHYGVAPVMLARRWALDRCQRDFRHRGTLRPHKRRGRRSAGMRGRGRRRLVFGPCRADFPCHRVQ